MARTAWEESEEEKVSLNTTIVQLRKRIMSDGSFTARENEVCLNKRIHLGRCLPKDPKLQQSQCLSRATAHCAAGPMNSSCKHSEMHSRAHITVCVAPAVCESGFARR